MDDGTFKWNPYVKDDLTSQLLMEAIAFTKPDTRTRKRFVDVCTRLADFAGLNLMPQAVMAAIVISMTQCIICCRRLNADRRQILKASQAQS